MYSGRNDIDSKFDLEYSSVEIKGENNRFEKVVIPRIKNLKISRENFYENNPKLPKDGIFRYKSKGIAIAPFVVVDEKALVWTDYAGYAHLSVNVWFFGWIREFKIRQYWAI